MPKAIWNDTVIAASDTFKPWKATSTFPQTP
jgi:hypothetical protein